MQVAASQRHPCAFDTAAPGFVARYSCATHMAEAGLRVIAGRFGENGRGFLPVTKYRAGFPSDNARFAQRHVQAYPEVPALAMICGPCEAGNVFVLDVDRGHAAGVDGFASVRALLVEHGEEAFPLGPRWMTPRNGCHLLFTAPAGVNVRNMSGKHGPRPGIDVRGANALATIPPSVRSDGAYRWVVAPWLAPIPPAPEWLLALVQERPRPAAVPIERLTLQRCTDRERNRRAAYIERALDGEISDLALCVCGGRNLALFQAAAVAAGFATGEPEFAPREEGMRARLFSAAVANGLVADDGAAAAHLTISSGFRAGRTSPRFVPPKQNGAQSGDHAPLA